MEREPGSQSWTRQVPTLPGRSPHAQPTISVCVSSGLILPEAGFIDSRVSTAYTRGI